MSSLTRPCEGATVLVAEDDSARRARITTALREEGFVVSEAREATELIELVHAAHSEDGAAPDLIVTNDRLPGASGLEALASLGKIIAGSAVIVVTAFSSANTRRIEREVSSVAELRRSFDLDDLRRLATRSVMARG